MTLIERIDDIYEKMLITPLSKILPAVLPIALECQDYEGYCFLSYWGKPIIKDVKANTVANGDIIDTLLQEGINYNDAKNIFETSYDKYLTTRYFEKDLICVFSAKGLEDAIKGLEDSIKALEIPEGMHPVDLYVRTNEVSKEKIHLLAERNKLERQYEILNNLISTKLSQYRRKANYIERKVEMEKGIKNSKDVFIIHGHDEAKLLELEKILKEEFRLNPIVLKDKPSQGLTIIDKFEKYAKQCSYAFALFTPDDIVSDGDNEYFQARPNVIFELGWFYANLGRNRVCIVEQESPKSKIFSDLQGVLRVQFSKDVKECFLEIKRELESVGLI